jgi:hypothetical protein
MPGTLVVTVTARGDIDAEKTIVERLRERWTVEPLDRVRYRVVTPEGADREVEFDEVVAFLDSAVPEWREVAQVELER